MHERQKIALVVGGSSGLGLALARQLVANDYHVYVTGTGNAPKDSSLSFIYFEIQEDVTKLTKAIAGLLLRIDNPIDVFIYAAGFSQVCEITRLSATEISRMINVCMLGLIMSIKEILKQQGVLPVCITIGSTTQTIPRARESVYAASKAGAAQFTWSVIQDKESIWRGLVVEVTGMQTKMQEGREDFDQLLPPNKVAKEIMGWLLSEDERPHMRILRNPDIEVSFPKPLWKGKEDRTH